MLQWILYPPKYISTLQQSVEPWPQFYRKHQWCSRGGTRGTPFSQIFLGNAILLNDIKSRKNYKNFL